ncbi:MAG: nucleoside triphosphate pyrophosphohydrolase [Desulfobacterales bacterium RIFOXYA12_FULL_46_15]|nr:MAG: nucleoside triphosphate pyrophosphohydrolase [Desulfobacula sp. GWF2_41_7]OGR24662.1 MAG: nucleoside triphosphate pyrophosphohydrolase [Desulfobacterales bacterium RIFOXYA12_FULL_46_15]
METLDNLFDIIRTLRSDKGCAWDRKQTPETMWQCLAEEVYELEEAIVKKDSQHICEELGDVLFQFLFILEIFQEKQAISLAEVVETVACKMIRRHPHVYENAVISNEGELNRQWESIKALEKGKNDRKNESALDSVPSGMASLIRALKVSQVAVKEGFDWDHINEILETAKSEIGEFEAALKSQDENEAAMEFGDILFSLVNVARAARFHPETALALATAKFEGRFRLMEKELKGKNLKLQTLSKDEKELLWNRAKQSYQR